MADRTRWFFYAGISVIDTIALQQYAAQGRWGYALFYTFLLCGMAGATASIITTHYIERHIDDEPSD